MCPTMDQCREMLVSVTRRLHDTHDLAAFISTIKANRSILRVWERYAKKCQLLGWDTITRVDGEQFLRVFHEPISILDSSPVSACWDRTGGMEDFVADVLNLHTATLFALPTNYASTMVDTPKCDDPVAYAASQRHLRAFAFTYLLPDDLMHNLDITLHCPETVVVMLYERFTSPPWSNWPQKWTDRGRATCFATSATMKFRQYASHATGGEQWATVHGHCE